MRRATRCRVSADGALKYGTEFFSMKSKRLALLVTGSDGFFLSGDIYAQSDRYICFPWCEKHVTTRHYAPLSLRSLGFSFLDVARVSARPGMGAQL